MNEKEIKDLAREYAKSNIPKGIDEEYSRSIVFSDGEMFERFLKWLSERYCIVEKSKVKESYREHKESYDRLCKSQWDETPYQCEEQGAMDELESLFGKELFSNTEQ